MPDDLDLLAGLPDDVAVLLRGYRPLLADACHGPLIAGLAAAVRPVSRQDASGLLGALSGLVLWAQETGVNIDPDVLLARDVVNRYVAVGLADYAPSSRRHVRRHLDRAAAAQDLAGTARRWGSAGSDGPPEEPYTPTEVDALLSWADGQPHARWRRSLLVLLALGLGCGLTNGDVRTVNGENVTVHADGTVTVRVGGERPREVVCARRFESLLAGLAPDAAGGWLVHPPTIPTDAQDVVMIVHRTRAGEGVPPLTLGRCRSTWLAGRLAAGVRMDVLAQAAGLVDAQTLLADRPWQLEPEPEEQARRALHAATHPPGLLRPPRPVPAPVSIPTLGPAAQAVLDRYRPRLADPRHAPNIRLVAAAAGPSSPQEAGYMAGAAADLFGWADRHELPTDLAGVLRRDTIDAWATAADGAARWAVGVRIGRLRWIEQAVAVLAPAQQLPDEHNGPYTRSEIDALTAWADRQPDPAVRLPLTALLHTALGTGLRPEELKTARGSHVAVDPATGAVLLTAHGPRGRPDRAVPVLAEHEDHVRAAARRAGPGWLLDPTADGTGRLAVIRITKAAPRTASVPALTALRCRLTWLTAQLASGTRPDTLLRAAGLTSTANLNEYAKALPPLPPEQARASLRGH